MDFLFGVLRERRYYLGSLLAPSSVHMSHGRHIFFTPWRKTCRPVWYLAALVKFFLVTLLLGQIFQITRTKARSDNPLTLSVRVDTNSSLPA